LGFPFIATFVKGRSYSCGKATEQIFADQKLTPVFGYTKPIAQKLKAEKDGYLLNYCKQRKKTDRDG